MKMVFFLHFSKILLTLVLLTGAAITGRAENMNDTKEAIAELGGEFKSGIAQVNGASIHYVQGGAGPALILVHGFPQDWYEFHKNLGYFFKNFGKFTPSAQAHYVKAYTSPAQLHAAFEIYRAFPANAQFNAAQGEPNNVAPLALRDHPRHGQRRSFQHKAWLPHNRLGLCYEKLLSLLLESPIRGRCRQNDIG